MRRTAPARLGSPRSSPTSPTPDRIDGRRPASLSGCGSWPTCCGPPTWIAWWSSTRTPPRSSPASVSRWRPRPPCRCSHLHGRHRPTSAAYHRAAITDVAAVAGREGLPRASPVPSAARRRGSTDPARSAMRLIWDRRPVATTTPPAAGSQGRVRGTPCCPTADVTGRDRTCGRATPPAVFSGRVPPRSRAQGSAAGGRHRAGRCPDAAWCASRW